MTQSASQPVAMFKNELVPAAERLGETTLSEARFNNQTIWENPEDHDVILELHDEVPTHGKPPRSDNERRGVVQRMIPKRSTRAIESKFDLAIQDVRCKHPDCTLRQRDCKNQNHPKRIVGGLAPRLINRGLQTRPEMDTALDDKRAELVAREQRLTDKLLQKAQLDEDLDKARAELADFQKTMAELRAAKAELEKANTAALEAATAPAVTDGKKKG
jgi:hypothetical protein